MDKDTDDVRDDLVLPMGSVKLKALSKEIFEAHAADIDVLVSVLKCMNYE